MTNVAEKAPTGSVEWYAKLLRRIRPDNRANVAMAVVQVIAADEYVPERSKVRRIVAVAEAVDLLEREHIAELRAAAKVGTAAEHLPDPAPEVVAAGMVELTGEVRAAKAEGIETYLKPGDHVVRRGGMPAGFPDTLRVIKVEPIEGSGETSPQRWQFLSAERPGWWLHCDEYVPADAE